jgi:predicted phosphoadenosine phosphosulfate sulfurtransferase
VTATILAKRPLDQDVYSLALERTAYVLDTFDHVWVSFSGGKDSTAVLNVTLEVAHSGPRFKRHLPLRAVFFDEEAIPYETEDYVRRTAQRDDVALEWLCIPVKHRNACSRRSPNWWTWAPESRNLWCRPLPPEAITKLDGFAAEPPSARLSIPHTAGLLCPPEYGNVAMLMGIRAAESLTRYRAVAHRTLDNYIIRFDQGTSRGNAWKSYPVYDWSTEDVWTAPALKGWDYNSAYDRLEMAGVPASQQRCSPAFGEEPLQGLHTYAQCFPEVWEKMAERVPGVGSAVRYARTELYAYSERPAKPDGITWPDFIAHYVAKHPPEVTPAVAIRLSDDIRYHYRKTSAPILEKAPHPATGLSWTFLLTVAMRGDFKGRKQADGLVRPDGSPQRLRQWQAWAAELAELMAVGREAEVAYPRAWPEDPLTLVPEYAREACGR